MLQTIFFKFALFAFLHPVVAIKSIGIQAGNNHRLVVETRGTLAETTEESQTCLVPSAGNDRGFAFGAHGTEEIHRFVVRIGQAYGHNHVADTHIEGGMNQTCDMKLLNGHFTTLLQLGFVFAILGFFEFEGGSGTTGLEFDLRSHDPFGRKLIIECQDKARNRNRGACFFRTPLGMTVETIHAVIFEGRNHFAITAQTETTEAVVLIIVGILFAFALVFAMRTVAMLHCGTGHSVGTLCVLYRSFGSVGFKIRAYAHNAVLDGTLCGGCARKSGP